MGAKLLYGYDPVNAEWIPMAVNPDGTLKLILAPKIAQLGVLVNLFWETFDPWSTGHTGSGVSAWGILNLTHQTGAVINSISRVYSGGHLAGFYNGLRYSVDCSVDQNAGHNDWIGHFPNVAPPVPTNVCTHIGFKIVAGRIWASNGNGVAGTQTDTLIDMGVWMTRWLYLEHKGTSIDFYIDTVLKATHTTNIPAPGFSRIMSYITNTVAANRYLQVRRHHLVFEGPY